MKTIRARLINGELVPLKPLPKDWLEGDEIVFVRHRVITRSAKSDSRSTEPKTAKRASTKRSRRREG
jgi:hypothetical protein